MACVEVDGASIHYELEGPAAAPALLLLHSLGADAGMWAPQLRGWTQRFRVLRPEVRGHGSSAPGGVPELSIERLARDALAVLDAAQIRCAHWCGLSLGGMTALWAAIHQPERVARLVLCDTSAHLPPPSLWQSRLEAARRDGMAALVPGIIERWFTASFRACSPEQVEPIRAMLRRVDPWSYAAACAAIRDMDQRAELGRIGAPTLVVCGEQDPATPLPHSQLLCEGIPGAQLVLLRASHLSNVEAAQDFTAAVEAFLAHR
jgi:3-oxoadipate enol-lactonase